MTKKDYIAIAAALNSQVRVTYAETALQTVRHQTLSDIAEQLAIAFARDNGRFDRDRFFAACGLEGGR